VARHARDAVLHLPVRTPLVADDVGRSLGNAISVPVHQQVRLEAVGKVENDLAAIVKKMSLFVSWAKRMLERVPTTDVCGEVVADPYSAVTKVVPFDETVVLRHAGVAKACANDAVLCNVALQVNIQLRKQFLERRGNLEHLVIERRA